MLGFRELARGRERSLRCLSLTVLRGAAGLSGPYRDAQPAAAELGREHLFPWMFCILHLWSSSGFTNIN